MNKTNKFGAWSLEFGVVSFLLLVSCCFFLFTGCSSVSNPTTTSTGTSTTTTGTGTTTTGTGTTTTGTGTSTTGTGSTTSTTIDNQAYFPHANGDAWRIDMLGEEYYYVATFEGTIVISPTITAQKLKYTYNYHGTYSTAENYYVINDNGVYTHGYTGHPTTEGSLILSFPLIVGSTWTQFSSSYVTVEATIISRESVTVTAGTFDCFKVAFVNHYSYTTEVLTDYMWYGYNAGLIRVTTDATPDIFELSWKNF